MHDADVSALGAREGLRGPDVRVPSARSAVERRVVVLVAYRHGVVPAVEGEPALGDAVAVASDDRAEVRVGVLPTRRRIESDGDVDEIPLGVGDHQFDDLPAVVSDVHHKSALPLQGIERGLFAVLRGSERGGRYGVVRAEHCAARHCGCGSDDGELLHFSFCPFQ